MTPLDSATELLSQLPAISLSAIESAAALQSRKDRKYLVPLATLGEVYKRLDQDTMVLEIAGKRAFRYETVYFDTPELRAYHDSARDRPRRHKVRTRAYLDSGLCALEVKMRTRQGQTVKHRMPYDLLHRTELTTAAHGFIKDCGANDPPSHTLNPTLTTHYNRTTLLISSAAGRATIDTHLGWTHPAGSELTLPGLTMVETKSRRGRTEFDKLLWEHRLRPNKISKYCVGLAVLNPGLSANKWNRILRTHFGWARAPVG